MFRPFALAVLALSIAIPAAATTVVSKPPDLGSSFSPLSPNGGSYVYASSFVSPLHDLRVTRLGTWLREGADPAPSVRFEVWGEAKGGGPDASNVIATTGSISPAADGTLTYFEAPVSGPSQPLGPGVRYWFVATVVGESGNGVLELGGHTQNSVYPDNGVFWYSNDPAGETLETLGPPEMAFQVELDPIILIYDDPCNGSPAYFRNAVDALGIPYSTVTNPADFEFAVTGYDGWELIVADSYNSLLPSAAETALIDHLERGGRLAITFWDLPFHPDLIAALDAAAVSSFDTPLSLSRWLSGPPLFQSPNELPNPLTPTQDFCPADGSRYDATAFGRAIGGYTSSPTSGQGGLILGNTGRSVLVGETLANFDGDFNVSKEPDGFELAWNILDHLLHVIYVDGFESGVLCAWSSAPGSSAPCASWCGDGDLDVGEECDDGNLFGGDGCGITCRWSCENLCGGQHPSTFCWCDSKCFDEGDCCSDVCDECGLSCGPVGPEPSAACSPAPLFEAPRFGSGAGR